MEVNKALTIDYTFCDLLLSQANYDVDLKDNDEIEVNFPFTRILTVNSDKLIFKLSKEEIQKKSLIYQDYDTTKDPIINEYGWKTYPKINKFIPVEIDGENGIINFDKDWDYTIINSSLINNFLKKNQEQNIKNSNNCGILINNISKNIHQEILDLINIYSSKTKPDFHPFSDNMIRDIVHPSLYPYVEDVSILKNEDQVYISKDEEERVDYWNRDYEYSKYQWLPSEFKVRDGKCKITSYINNLPIEEKGMYKKIEELFDLTLPYFEKIYGYIKTVKLYNTDRANDLDVKGNINEDVVPISLQNSDLQVIVKIVSYSLKNGKTIDGAWHVEGMSHENIIMTGIHVLDQKNVDATLHFKRRYTESEACYLYTHMPQERPYFIDQIINNKGTLPLGKIDIEKNNLILFPNSHIHKLDIKSNANDGERKVLLFWVINPEKRIISTKDVDPQQNLKSFDAINHRLELMKERKYLKQNFNVREINLCEH